MTTESIRQDLRYALRGFRKSPGFAAVALLSLALGIGANTALFSVVWGVIVSPYPYKDPHEIWAPSIRALNTNQGRGSHWIGEFLDISKLPAFSGAMATGWDNVLLTGEYAPESFQGILLSGGAFNFLGVPPVIGRTIQPSDIKPTGEPEPVVVISYKLWQRLFNGEPGAIGKTLRLNERQHTVIGVMPPRFGWYGNNGFWLPLPADRRYAGMLNVILRLKPGVSATTAEQELHALHQRFAQENPRNFPRDGFRTVLTNYMDITVASGEMRTSLQLLFGACGLLLLIACANVANLQLSRATARAREMAVRLSVGAGRGRLLRQLLTESVLLSFLGGALGVLFAVWLTRVVVNLMPEFYTPNEARITVNVQVLIFSIAVSALTGVLFGLAPAINASRPDLTEALKDAARGSGTRAQSGRTRSLLVLAEVALSVMLLVAAGLTIRSFLALQSVDLGFQTERVLMVSLPHSPKRYPTVEVRNRFSQDLLERVKNLPGVEAAAVGVGGLPFGGPQSPYTIEGRATTERSRLTLNLISTDYLRTLGIPLRRGRSLTEQEIRMADRFALINEAAAKLWPDGEDPLGKRIRIDLLAGSPRAISPGDGPPRASADSAEAWVTVVGIVGNTRNGGRRNEPSAAALVPYTLIAPPQRILAVRSRGNPSLLLNAVRDQVLALDSQQPIGRTITIEEVLGFDTVQPRFTTALFTFFAMMGMMIAAVGIYSVLAYHVARRRHEIGVRMALGAERRDVLRLVLAMGAKLVLAGIVIGVAGSFAAATLLQNLLFQIKARDPGAFAAVVVVLSAVALLACYIPARRAAKVDPMIALRHE